MGGSVQIVENFAYKKIDFLLGRFNKYNLIIFKVKLYTYENKKIEQLYLPKYTILRVCFITEIGRLQFDTSTLHHHETSMRSQFFIYFYRNFIKI